MWGDPKKTGFAQLYVDGHQMHGYGERDGVRLIEVDGEFGPDLGPVEMEGLDFELKATLHGSGFGLQDDVVLTCMKNRESYRVRREGNGVAPVTQDTRTPLG